MHSNTSSNRINWYSLVSSICCICLFLSICYGGAQAAGNQVTIETDAVTYSEVGFAVDVTVKFEDMSLYNDQVYLSYHIVDEEGGELLFENQRIPVNLDTEYMTIYVDCANLEELADRETAVIQFDLVDEGNAYWFSTNANIAFQAASVTFDRNLLQTPEPKMPDSPDENVAESVGEASILTSVLLNGFAWVAIAVIVISIRKNRRAEQSRAEQSRAERD